MWLRYPWPTCEEYDEAVKQWKHTIQDPELRSGEVEFFGATDTPKPQGGAGNYARVYHIGNWSAKCFCLNPLYPKGPPSDILTRYEKIETFTREAEDHVPSVTRVDYLRQGITVNERGLPIIKMSWLKNQHTHSLGPFVERYHSQPDMMRRLTNAWVSMVSDLEAAPMAHGDLDLSNVLVRQHNDRLVLKLIDYDNVWVPDLIGHAQTELGHPAFQHPAYQRIEDRPYNAEMDRFSALVIYISFKALEFDPNLYSECGADEQTRLLLSIDDYVDPDRRGGNIAKLSRIPELGPYVMELYASLQYKRMPRSLWQISQNSGRRVMIFPNAPAGVPTIPTSTIDSHASLRQPEPVPKISRSANRQVVNTDEAPEPTNDTEWSVVGCACLVVMAAVLVLLGWSLIQWLF